MWEDGYYDVEEECDLCFDLVGEGVWWGEGGCK